jgi:hypothetical protein
MPFAGEMGAGCVEQFLHRPRAGARGRLIGGEYRAADAVALVYRPKRYESDDRRAIRIGDEAAMGFDRRRIDLRHDQRDIGFHPKCRRVVDDDCAAADGPGRIIARDAAAGREQGQIDAGEAAFRERLDGDLTIGEGQYPTRRARRPEEAQFRDRKFAVCQHAQQFAADGAGRADDRDRRGRTRQAEREGECRWIVGHARLHC